MFTKKKRILVMSLIISAGMGMSYAAEKTATLTKTEKAQIKAAGWNMGKQSMDAAKEQFGLTTQEEVNAMLSGIISGAKGEKSPIDLEKDSEAMLEYMQGRVNAQIKKRQDVLAQETAKNRREAKAFFAKLDKKAKVMKTESGLYYEVLKKGTGIKPTETSTVQINYVGKLIDKTEFDSSTAHGGPAKFPLGGVIPGFREGLQLIGKGGKIRLYIPSELGYGDNPLPNIPPASTLIFDVDMLDVINEGKGTTS